MRRIYLDDAGFAPILPAVVQARTAAHVEGNASSPHTEGRAARARLDALRDTVARKTGRDRTEVTFVASGTEAVNLAVFGAAARLPTTGRLLTWASEHQSVLGAFRRLQAQGRDVRIANVDSEGAVDLDAIEPGVAFVSVGLANNEVGTIQPVADVVKRAHAVGALVHVDACAGPRWIDLPLGADLASLSGQKLGAGRGGVLLVADGVRIDPLLFGGPQEWGRRAGHEDVDAAGALAAAISETWSERRAARAQAAARQSARLRSALVELGAQLTGSDSRLPNFASCTFDGRRGEDMLMALDLAGMAVSSGSACASGSLDPSHVLLAMGFTLERSLGSLRLTTGYDTTDEEVELAVAILPRVLTRAAAHA
ncbi:MAG TPA: aminotransferase class V-fold PLP-dependent enzyme [Polyangiaceae bacterium]|nr:aminotransferase class V-fold PLP-dependent enzyme [Polyangiaceae bacterium]